METWGADTFRTYLMSLGPYEAGGDFRDSGLSGPQRFLDKLWLSAHTAVTEGTPEVRGGASAPQGGRRASGGGPSPEVLRKLHQTIKKVGEDIPRLSYNTAIAAMMEYMNVLRANDRTPHRAEVEPLVQLVAPFAPHVAEELWERLGHTESVFDAGWPSYDPTLATEETVQLAVQVNGKLRGTVRVAREATQDDAFAAAMAEPSVAKWVTGPPKKIIYVKGRLLNIVV